jgi:LmbE family N-acetylglucosaminyl deacetylase
MAAGPAGSKGSAQLAFEAPHATAAATRILDCLVAGRPSREAVAIVAAHPDDETLGVGGRMAKLRQLHLLHLTDGAPRDMDDARRAGFGSWEDYARARQTELRGALQVLAVQAVVGTYGCPDKQAILELVNITRRLVTDLAQVGVVITHSYEHGHPDHDAAAFSVHAACTLLQQQRGFAPLIVEFPSYHLREHQLVLGRFWPDSSCCEHTADLKPQAVALKSRALACFLTQHTVVRAFPLNPERYRRAPTYDFTRPAPPGAAVYDSLGWQINSHSWLAYATAARRELGLAGPT